MSLDGVWGDLVCNYVMSKILPMPFTVVTPKLTWTANEEKRTHHIATPYEIVIVYNGFNHYVSTSM